MITEALIVDEGKRLVALPRMFVILSVPTTSWHGENDAEISNEEPLA